MSTLLFVDESKGPPWITETIQQGDFLKGKLNCPHCKGRLGAFDFLSHISCACGQHTIPPVRVLKDRVDVAQIVGNQSVVTIFRKKRPFGKQQGNEVSSISNQNIVKSTAQSEQSSVSTSAQQCNSGSETENIGTMSSEDVSRGASCETLPCDQENSESCHNAEDNCENSENSNVEDVNIFSFLNQEEFVNVSMANLVYIIKAVAFNTFCYNVFFNVLNLNCITHQLFLKLSELYIYGKNYRL